ncbi:SDR family oxidoreductase [Corallibacter sp.]|uniref:SDR family oxidoreductase n=1 Tax=Corallibacter sp. TaxID=2038084 RepID=UPI003AB89F25
MILVTGASGQLGDLVVKQLLNKIQASEIAVLSRDTSKVENLKKLGVEVRQGDYDNYKTLVNAFAGIKKLYFVSASDIEKRDSQHENVVNAAIEAGIEHIVYTSFQRKTDKKDSVIGFIANSHLDTEQKIKDSGLTYTILKHALYMEVIPLFIGDNVLDTKTIYIPTEQGQVSFVSRKDLAEGAAIILTTSGHNNKVYEFGNDKVLSMQDIAQELSKLANQTISYTSPKPEDFVATLTQNNVPKPFIDLRLGFSIGIAADEFNNPTDELKNLLGKDLISISSYLKDTYFKE